MASAPVLTLGSHGAFTGAEVIGNQAGVAANMAAVSNALNLLSANTTLSSLVLGTGGSTTFTNSSTTGGVYVIDINGNFNLNGSTLNLVAANAADTFVININGTFGFSQSITTLTGGINAGQVIFNITDNCGLAEVNKGTSVWNGVILAPNCDVRAHNAMNFTGELFGQDVTVDSGIQLTSPPPTVNTPEPASLTMLGTGLLGLAGTLRRRFRP